MGFRRFSRKIRIPGKNGEGSTRISWTSWCILFAMRFRGRTAPEDHRVSCSMGHISSDTRSQCQRIQGLSVIALLQSRQNRKFKGRSKGKGPARNIWVFQWGTLCWFQREAERKPHLPKQVREVSCSPGPKTEHCLLCSSFGSGRQSRDSLLVV